MQRNGTGLSSARLDELCAWAHNQTLRVLVLQETRCEWVGLSWGIISVMGKPRRGTGLLSWLTQFLRSIPHCMDPHPM